MNKRIWKSVLTLAALMLFSIALAACGSSSSSTSEPESTAATTESEKSSGGQEEANIAAAKKAIQPYIGQPSPFPVTEPLKKRPKGELVSSVFCGTPYCALIQEFAKEAGETLGVDVSNIKSGASASAVSSAFDTAVAQNPAAVITGGNDIELWQNQLKTLQAEETPVVTVSEMKAEEYGLNPSVNGPAEFDRDGKLMADYVVAEFGTESDVVFYGVPELPFTPVLEGAFNEELATKCPTCKVRSVEVPVETIGNTAPTRVVSDLQQHPETNVAVFGTDEVQIGLPAALKAAGIEIKTLGYGATPTNLQYLEEGKETAVLSNDPLMLGWTAIDEAARLMTGQEPSGPEAEGLNVIQFLRPEDITFDPSKGWTGYPDYKERFEKLWGIK